MRYGWSSLVLTDLYRGTSTRDMFRGWGEILITLIVLYVMRVLIGSDWARLASRHRGRLCGNGRSAVALSCEQ